MEFGNGFFLVFWGCVCSGYGEFSIFNLFSWVCLDSDGYDNGVVVIIVIV